MLPQKMCNRLTIFEGPDGGGKTTAARRFAEETDAKYIHFGPLPRVTRGLARMYLEAMQPALLGYQDVVFDRSWLSELPYGCAYRDGKDRLGAATRRMLERVAMRCGASIAMCLPNEETVVNNFKTAKQSDASSEMLAKVSQLRRVYQIYEMESLYTHTSHLPVVRYDYETHDWIHFRQCTEIGRFRRHCSDIQSAGNLHAPILIVGDKFAAQKNDDNFYQWPFVSFNNTGCSQWLTRQLHLYDVSEVELCWINADQLDKAYQYWETIGRFDGPRKIIALGKIASESLKKYTSRDDIITVPHPQHHKRFGGKPGLGNHYELFDHLK